MGTRAGGTAVKGASECIAPAASAHYWHYRRYHHHHNHHYGYRRCRW